MLSKLKLKLRRHSTALLVHTMGMVLVVLLHTLQDTICPPSVATPIILWVHILLLACPSIKQAIWMLLRPIHHHTTAIMDRALIHHLHLMDMVVIIHMVDT